MTTKASTRVKVGKLYRYDPVMFDQLWPVSDAKSGDIVRVVNLPGCPPANTMGNCYITIGGSFGGMVRTASLVSLEEEVGWQLKHD